MADDGGPDVATMGAAVPQPLSAEGFNYPDIAVNIAEASREMIYIPPRNGEDGYGPSSNPRISIPLPPGQNYWDPRNSHIMADVTQSYVGAAPAVENQDLRLAFIGLASCIRTFIFKQQGGQPILRIDNYHIVLSVLAYFYSHEWLVKAGRRYGYGTDTQRQEDAIYPGGKRMELDTAIVGVFRSGKMIPNYAAGMEIVLELEQPLLAQVATTGSPTYALSQVKMMTELVTGTAMLDEQILEGMAMGMPLSIPMDLYRYVPQAVLVGEVVTQKNFSVSQDSVVTYFNRFVLQADLALQGRDPLEFSVNPGILSEQLQMGAQLLPPQPLNFEAGGAESKAMIHNAMFRHESPISAIFDDDTYAANPPVEGVPTSGSRLLTVIPIGSARDAHQNAGLNLNTPPGQSTLRLQLRQALTSVLQVFQVVNYVGHMRVLPNQIEMVA